MFACLLAATAAAQADDKRLLVMGDSLSAAYGLATEQGWVHLLDQRLQRERPGWRIVNASISGETTSGGAARIAGELARHAPSAVLIELGANDGLRGLPLEIAGDNLDKMIRAAQDAGARVGLIGMQIPPNYGPDYTRGFIAMYADLAARHELPLEPFLLAPIVSERDAFLDDNLHPAASAQPRLAEHLWPLLRTLVDAADAAPTAGN
ncbi:MAG: arylesterase [Lysobacteraceae bacterium]